MSIEWVLLFNYLILCHPLLLLPSIFPSIRVFSNESVLCIRWPKNWSFSISPCSDYQGWFPLGLTGLISLNSKGLSRVFSKTEVQKHQFFRAQHSVNCDAIYMKVYGKSYEIYFLKISFQFSSITQSCPALCKPMGCSTPGFPVHHQLPELTQTHVHWVGDAIQPSHPLLSPLLLSSIFRSIRVFSKVSSCDSFQTQFLASGGQSIGVSASVSVLPTNIQHRFPFGLTISKGLSRVFSNTIVQKHQFFGTQLSL